MENTLSNFSAIAYSSSRIDLLVVLSFTRHFPVIGFWVFLYSLGPIYLHPCPPEMDAFRVCRGLLLHFRKTSFPPVGRCSWHLSGSFPGFGWFFYPIILPPDCFSRRLPLRPRPISSARTSGGRFPPALSPTISHQIPRETPIRCDFPGAFPFPPLFFPSVKIGFNFTAASSSPSSLSHGRSSSAGKTVFY